LCFENWCFIYFCSWHGNWKFGLVMWKLFVWDKGRLSEWNPLDQSSISTLTFHYFTTCVKVLLIEFLKIVLPKIVKTFIIKIFVLDNREMIMRSNFMRLKFDFSMRLKLWSWDQNLTFSWDPNYNHEIKVG
jgi:hypothetical protein